ncbi:hypothetical protein J3F83DRAFT_17634 [Trichoderma novae-zelandiae]
MDVGGGQPPHPSPGPRFRPAERNAFFYPFCLLGFLMQVSYFNLTRWQGSNLYVVTVLAKCGSGFASLHKPLSCKHMQVQNSSCMPPMIRLWYLSFPGGIPFIYARTRRYSPVLVRAYKYSTDFPAASSYIALALSFHLFARD